jgi:hypothetical protein
MGLTGVSMHNFHIILPVSEVLTCLVGPEGWSEADRKKRYHSISRHRLPTCRLSVGLFCLFQPFKVGPTDNCSVVSLELSKKFADVHTASSRPLRVLLRCPVRPGKNARKTENV